MRRYVYNFLLIIIITILQVLFEPSLASHMVLSYSARASHCQMVFFSPANKDAPSYFAHSPHAQLQGQVRRHAPRTPLISFIIVLVTFRKIVRKIVKNSVRLFCNNVTWSREKFSTHDWQTCCSPGSANFPWAHLVHVTACVIYVEVSIHVCVKLSFTRV